MTALADQVADLVALELGLDSVELSDRVVEDLGAESVDVLNIVTLLEERFPIHIDEERLSTLHTVQDLADEVSVLLRQD